MKLYQELACLVLARDDNVKAKNDEWKFRHEERALQLVYKDHMPSGSGFDCGTHIHLGLSKPNKLVLTTSFHHMDEHGGYDGWTEHYVYVKPDLVNDIKIRVTGKNRNDIKDYIAEVFYDALMKDV